VTDGLERRDAESTWERLRRRKVVQWGLAYAAGAWGFLQGLQYLATAFEWPIVILKLGAVVFAIGLPIALVLAWYHGDRGEQSVSRAELAIITLLFLLGGGLFWYFQHSASTPVPVVSRPATAAVLPVAVADDRSIAVLPFVNMSSDREQDYFSDGISEELLNLLTKVPELRVIARTSSFAFKGKDLDIAEIAQRLNVAHVLEGSVRKSGDKVRITAQLVRAVDSTHLWSETYDRRLDDVFAIQDEIAGAVVAQLKIKLLGAGPTAKPVDARVYPLLLQAKAMGYQGSAAGTRKAIALYREAIAIAPDEPRAWSGLGEMYFQEGGFVQRPMIEARRLARDAFEKALALDPDDALSHALLGAVMAAADLAGAAAHIERALALDRSNVDILSYAGGLLGSLGRTEQEIALYAYSASRDPANPTRHNDLGVTNYYAGHWDEAIASLRTATTLSPGLIGAHYTIGQALLMKGQPTAALADMQLEPDEPSRLQGIALAEHSLGHSAKSDAALDAVLAKYPAGQAGWIAVVYAWRGETDRAFAYLDHAVDDQEALGWVPWEPMFASLHDDPRWLPLLRRLGRAPEQLAAIKFDVSIPQ
jgi:TolB-like protein/tetratricopeptide (TPR) repeat protein